jgi:uncharacterized protein YjbI with pentapeptide repeats
MGTNADHYEVEPLEKAVNDSAVRVSAIWVSFLVFGLYLVIAIGGVTHLALFLGGPIKLPVLNVDLPLGSFFFLAPVLFVIFHAYLLVQVLLLCRTAAAYNEAVEHSIMVASDRARVRQRLANTLFAQIFAGSPREREGLLGALLRFMARVTLVIGPVFVLLMFEVKFLPSQDPDVTLTHRVLIAVDLAMVLVLWREVLGSPLDIGWRLVAKRSAALFIAIALVVFSWLGVNFPGESHANWMRPNDECGYLIFPGRLELRWVDVVDDEKLAKIEKTAKVKGLPAYQGERTRDFSHRRLRCGDFYRADFRRVDFTDADLRDAKLAYAELHGTSLSGANLRGVDLEGAQMQGADLSLGQRREGYSASRDSVTFDFFAGADLRNAWLPTAQLQGARLAYANMGGAFLRAAQLQGANLNSARLEGVDLTGAQMQGADLGNAQMQGADLISAQMMGANLTRAHMEGARLDQSSLTLALVRHGYLWRARGAKCDDAQVTEPQLDLMLEDRQNIPEGERKATADEQAKEIDKWLGGLRKTEEQKLRKQLVADAEHDDATNDVWRDCEAKTLTQGDHETKHANYLIELACGTTHSQKYVAYGIYSNWVGESELLAGSSGPLSVAHLQTVVRGLLGCPGANELGERAIKRLQELAHRHPR